METHHEQAIQRLVDLFQNDPNFPTLIIGGSVAHGNATPSSDVDVLLVASDEEYARRSAAHDLAYFNFELCDYPGGYIDGKIINHQYLLDAADHGSEPTRYALVGAYPAYSRIPDLASLLQRIAVYPEHERQHKMDAFYSQVLVLGGYFIKQAAKRDDPYLMLHSVSDLVLFGSRLFLAYNRILFPCHKSLLEAVQRAPAKPTDFLDLANNLLRHPTPEHAEAFCSCITNYRDWGITYMQALNHFFDDSEWNWRFGRPPLGDS